MLSVLRAGSIGIDASEDGDERSQDDEQIKPD
jgi:hypothetical protein